MQIISYFKIFFNGFLINYELKNCININADAVCILLFMYEFRNRGGGFGFFGFFKLVGKHKGKRIGDCTKRDGNINVYYRVLF